MRALKALTLVVCFFLDVHVRAEALVGPSSGKKTMKLGEVEVVLDQNALLEERDGLRLVRGRIYIQGEDSAQVKMPFVTATCGGTCKAIFEREHDHVWIQNLEGAWTVKRVGESQLYALTPGMELRVGEVGGDGVAAMDFPQSLPWAPTLKVWGHLFPGDKSEFKDQVEAFRPRWQEAVDAAAKIHQEGATRTIASYEKSVRDKEAARQREERENARLRDLFREKNYLNP